ncbi:MAG: ATP-binding cassette domain-containing protein [Lysobacter sp.]|nr:MAG: ATP-binding cassette domain-containing protein [Lysobacter sp.]
MNARDRAVEDVSALPSNAMGAPVLVLRGFGVAYGSKVILAEIDLEIASAGMTVLVGPCGTGKSTLLRTLSGQSAANPALRTWGQADFAGLPLGAAAALPALVGQSARLMMSSVFENLICNLPDRARLTRIEQREIVERWLAQNALDELSSRLDEPVVNLQLALQRHVAIVRAAAAEPLLLCLDEPTANVSDEEATRLIEHLLREAQRRALIVSTHHQGHARRLGGRVAFLAGGRFQEIQPVERFFDAPTTQAGREFVRSGTCLLPSPDADPRDLDESVPPPPPLPAAARHAISDACGPRGFLWLRPGELAGTPLPGVFHDRDYDLAALQRVGIRHLINLTEHEMPSEATARFGIVSHWFPVVDMTPPSMTQAVQICKLIERSIAAGEPIAAHCRAGFGRTGTALAMYLISTGLGGLEALEAVRRVEPRWVQSQEQIDALETFASLSARMRAESILSRPGFDRRASAHIADGAISNPPSNAASNTN